MKEQSTTSEGESIVPTRRVTRKTHDREHDIAPTMEISSSDVSSRGGITSVRGVAVVESPEVGHVWDRRDREGGSRADSEPTVNLIAGGTVRESRSSGTSMRCGRPNG